MKDKNGITLKVRDLVSTPFGQGDIIAIDGDCAVVELDGAYNVRSNIVEFDDCNDLTYVE